jgi:CHAT domain-containing protein
LFGGAGRVLAGKPNWLLALDEALFQLPFAALPVGRRGEKPIYLVERHATRVIPTVLLRSPAPQPSPADSFLGVGDPVYNPADPRWPRKGLARFLPVLQAKSGVEMPRLLGSGREVEACAGIWDSPVLLKGMDASEYQLKQALGRNPSVVHFAVHVLQSRQAPIRRFDQTKPKGLPVESFLALSLSPTGAPEFLSPTQISSWRVHTGLVVLSGCSSAAADAPPATGLMGLTRAWLVAGAGAVAAALWPTPDSSGELFRSFYKHLRESGDPAKALQRAQLDMLRSDAWRSAAGFWAAYFVVGRN